MVTLTWYLFANNMYVCGYFSRPTQLDFHCVQISFRKYISTCRRDSKTALDQSTGNGKSLCVATCISDKASGNIRNVRKCFSTHTFSIPLRAIRALNKSPLTSMMSKIIAPNGEIIFPHLCCLTLHCC